VPGHITRPIKNLKSIHGIVEFIYFITVIVNTKIFAVVV
jgi:hypothetical protein